MLNSQFGKKYGKFYHNEIKEMEDEIDGKEIERKEIEIEETGRKEAERKTEMEEMGIEEIKRKIEMEEMEREDKNVRSMRVFPYGKDEKGNTLLHRSIVQGDIEMAKKIINFGSDTNAQNNNGTTALHLSSQEGNDMMIQVLLDNGANINSVNKYGDTALHIAADNKNVSCILILLKNKADTKIKNDKGKTAFNLVDDSRDLDFKNDVIKGMNSLLTPSNPLTEEVEEPAVIVEKKKEEDILPRSVEEMKKAAPIVSPPPVVHVHSQSVAFGPFIKILIFATALLSIRKVFISSSIVVEQFYNPFSSNENICLTSSQEFNLDWVRWLQTSSSLARGSKNPNIHYFKAIENSNGRSDFSLTEKLMLFSGCKLIVVEKVTGARHSFENFKTVSQQIGSPSAQVLLVNGTCELLNRYFNFDGSASYLNGCNANKINYFQKIVASEFKAYTGDAKVTLIEPQMSNSDFLSVIISSVSSESKNLPVLSQANQNGEGDHNLFIDESRFKQRLKELSNADPSSFCKVNSYEDENLFNSSLFSYLKFIVIGEASNGKSTTLYWLSLHLGLNDATVNTFAATGGGSSRTRSLSTHNFGQNLKVSDTMGITVSKIVNKGNHKNLVCHIKNIMNGTSTAYTGGAEFNWDSVCDDNVATGWFSFGQKNVQTKYSVNPDALVFVIMHTDDQNTIEGYKMLIEALRTDDSGDLTERMVFAISKATESMIDSFARKIGVTTNNGDIFPLNDKLDGKEFPIIPPHIFVPIMKRLIEKSCIYKQKETQNPPLLTGTSSSFLFDITNFSDSVIGYIISISCSICYFAFSYFILPSWISGVVVIFFGYIVEELLQIPLGPLNFIFRPTTEYYYFPHCILGSVSVLAMSSVPFFQSIWSTLCSIYQVISLLAIVYHAHLLSNEKKVEQKVLDSFCFLVPLMFTIPSWELILIFIAICSLWSLKFLPAKALVKLIYRGFVSFASYLILLQKTNINRINQRQVRRHF